MSFGVGKTVGWLALHGTHMAPVPPMQAQLRGWDRQSQQPCIAAGISHTAKSGVWSQQVWPSPSSRSFLCSLASK